MNETTVASRPPATGRPVVDMRGISVEFPGVKALQEVDFRLFAGEVHALMGENGAGKSTLIKTLTGVHRGDAGEIRVADRAVSFHGPAAAQAAGISTVYQELNLCTNLTVAENILLGREPRRFGRIDGTAMRARAKQVLERMGLHVDPGSTLGTRPIAVQ
jgi:galactofuranose transport system ATP-binding protein